MFSESNVGQSAFLGQRANAPEFLQARHKFPRDLVQTLAVTQALAAKGAE